MPGLEGGRQSWSGDLLPALRLVLRQSVYIMLHRRASHAKGIVFVSDGRHLIPAAI